MRVLLLLFSSVLLLWSDLVAAQGREPFFRQAFLVPATVSQAPAPNSYVDARVESFHFGAGSELISSDFLQVLRRVFRTDSGSVALTVKVSTESGATSGTQILSTFNMNNKQLTRFVEFNRLILPPTLLQPRDNVRFEFRLIRLKQSLPSETQKLLSSFAELPVGPWVKAFQAFGDTFIDTYRDLTANPQNAEDAAVYSLAASDLKTDQVLILTRYEGAPVSTTVAAHTNALTSDVRENGVDNIFIRLRTSTEVLIPSNTLAENSRMGPALSLVMKPYVSRAQQASGMADKFLECVRMRSHLRSMAMLSDFDVINVVADTMVSANFDPDAGLGSHEANRYQCLSQDELLSLRTRHAFTLGSCQDSCANAKNFLEDWLFGTSSRYTSVRWLLPTPGNGTVTQMAERWVLVNFSPLQRDTGSGATATYRTFACLYNVQSNTQSVVNLAIQADPIQKRAVLNATSVNTGQQQNAPAC